MSTTWRLYESWKAKRPGISITAAAQELGVSHTAIAFWRDGRNTTADVLAKMARDLGKDEKAVAALVLEAMAEGQSTNAKAAQTLTALARRVAALAVFGLGVLLGMQREPHETPHTGSSTHIGRTLDIMFRHVLSWLWLHTGRTMIAG